MILLSKLRFAVFELFCEDAYLFLQICNNYFVGCSLRFCIKNGVNICLVIVLYPSLECFHFFLQCIDLLFLL